MAQYYSNNGARRSSAYGGYGHYRQHTRRDSDSSLVDDLKAFLAHAIRSLWQFWNERGRFMVLAALVSFARQLRRNLTFNRLFSFPHLLVALWMFVMLWGERWTFHTKVESCHWDNWEKWPSGAVPHRVALVADPQLVDPHSYPGRPWPLNPLTVLITDNYLRRSYNQLQWQLDPDSIFFLGDLFDGGREWKTAHGDFRDPEWGKHPEREQKYVKKWNKKYGEDYWLREYARFGDIFFTPWVMGGRMPGAEDKRRKLVASLPGNHDLGFGAEIKVAVRDRFETYFGEGNRVDVVGNHTFVSVDTVSMSAAHSAEAERHDLRPIYMPTEIFLNNVRRTKQKAVEKELRFQRGEVQEPRFNHRIEELEHANFDDKPSFGREAPELPTVLLTHVPLFRPAGTPCGPMRERWPPTKPAKGQTGPVNPDHRNAISITRGYQYQNVLSEQDSVDLVKKVGNVIHAFSGDDHDYCEVVHDFRQGNVPEITVKSISMVMGVDKPGFLMLSLYNPLDENGKPLAGEGKATMQTHLCLLPSQASTYIRYASFAVVCIIVLAVRAFMVPLLKLQPFALEPEPTGRTVLPVFKAKVEDYDEYALPSAGFSASHYSHGSHTRERSGSFTPGVRSNGLASQARNSSSGKKSHAHHKGQGGGRWGWTGSRAPRIQIPSETEELYDGGKWKAVNMRQRSSLRVALTELWATVYRVAWMGLLFFFWLNLRG
ncbi:calcineurin-like phosphoesterase-domain-containing protein [Echria macrotheca]|uniref:Calcineurin-like phosphoesterase-domain-containing protein n=1 Tax=Echria macrotheca TaxID=438768 RepID=A0AAJ0BB70_9PEZI|nr:calcineurin-like phosphoesterase-domain-containing protein [Echria macrotheca]